MTEVNEISPIHSADGHGPKSERSSRAEDVATPRTLVAASPAIQAVRIWTASVECSSGCTADAVVAIEPLYDKMPSGLDALHLCPTCLTQVQHDLAALQETLAQAFW